MSGFRDDGVFYEGLPDDEPPIGVVVPDEPPTSRTCPGSGEIPEEWSARSRRGLCPVCHRPRVSMKKDGRLREHTPYESVRVSIPKAANR